MDSHKLTSKNWRGSTYSPTFKSSSAKQSKVRLFSYEDILLRLYVDISANGGFERLIISGRATLEKCVERWEEIVRMNSEESRSNQYQSYFSLNQGYANLMARHLNVKLLLMRCQITGSNDNGFNETIDELKHLGYKIDISSTEKYAESIASCMNNSNILVTKINQKQVEINDYLKRVNGKGKKADVFVDLLANLEEALGGNRSLPDDITLSKYNSLLRIAKAKQAAAKASQRAR